MAKPKPASQKQPNVKRAPDKKGDAVSVAEFLKLKQPKGDLILEVEGQQVPVTSLERVYWPDEKITKFDLLCYYLAVSPHMMPHLKDRPAILQRWPRGINAPMFFQQDLANPPYNGGTVELVANVHRNVGLVANFSATYANTTFVDSLSGRRFNARVWRYLLLGGPRFNWRNSSPVIPYAHALFGVARYRSDFRNRDFTCPDTSETAFAMALGAGLDIRAGKHIDVRAAQIDYLPVFFSNKREDGLRFSAGVKIKP